MEDQGKRLLLAVGLITIVFFVYTQFLAPKPPPEPVAPPAAETNPAATPTTPPADGVAPVASAASEKLCDPSTDEGLTWDNEGAVIRFSKCGGALVSVELKGKQWTEGEGDKQRQLNVVRTSENPAWFPLQVQVDSDKGKAAIPARAEWAASRGDGNVLTFVWSSPTAGLEVKKTYKPSAQPYAFLLETEVKNVSAEKRTVNLGVDIYGYQDPKAKTPGMFTYAPPAWNSACFVEGKVKHDTLGDMAEGVKRRTGDVRWTGVDQKYFLLAVAPIDKDSYACEHALLPAPAVGIMRSSLQVDAGAALDPGQSVKRTVLVYVGPKKLEMLEGLDDTFKHEFYLKKAVDLGWFSFIARPMLSLLEVFHGWVGNWGIAIILLTIVVKLLTLYWTHKSMKSMKAMSRLKPKMDELKEKYGEDKQRFQTEVMNLYKTHNINPLGGCLPILLQMPVWFALYQTLGSAADLYRAPFFGWLHDLTAPDPYFIIPVTLTLLMFLQAKIQPAAVDSAQQKMMQYMMPLMFGAFSLFFPSGLGVYIMTNTLLGMAHQFYLNKTDKGLPPTPAPVAEAPVVESPSPNKGGKSKKNNAAKKAAKA
jgi:YidC/Oxa1 family membrane protein insertase